MTPQLRRGAAVSVTIHFLLIVYLFFGLPFMKPPGPTEETAISMVFEGPPQNAQQAPAPAPTPSPAPMAAPVPAPPAPEQPKPEPTETPPPPPAAAATPHPPLPLPPVPVSPPTLSPELPPVASLPTPPAPPSVTPPLPVPPRPVPPPDEKPSTQPSKNSQPNPTKNPAPESLALENTLERLRALQKQTQAPKHRYNPAQGGAPGGGVPTGDTAALTADQRGAIGDYVRRCWTYDAAAPGVDQMRANLTVMTDADGVARDVRIAPQDEGRLGDPVFRAFFERARRAVLDPRCANLPLPREMLGERRTLNFRFSP